MNQDESSVRKVPGLLSHRDIDTITNAILSVLVVLNIFRAISYNDLGHNTPKEFKREKTELFLRLSAKKDSKQLSETEYKAAIILATKCKDELMSAVDIISANKNNPKDKSTVLNHIINAKGWAEKMKELGIPIDKELENIRTTAKLWITMKP